MIGQASPENICSLQAPPDTTSGEGGPREPQRLLLEPLDPTTREVLVVLHDAPAVETQEPLADVLLEALDIHADADYEDEHPAIDLGLWYKHACRPYLVNIVTGQPSYEVKRIAQNAEELRNWIKDDLLRTGRALLTLEFDGRRHIKVQKNQRMAKFRPRRRLFRIIFKKRVRQHVTPQGQNSLDDMGSVRSDESGSSWDTANSNSWDKANSNSSQTSESVMNDTEQSCAQLLRHIEETRLEIERAFRRFVTRTREFKDLQNALQKLEDSLKVHQGNAREIGFSDIGLALNNCHQNFEIETVDKLRTFENKSKDSKQKILSTMSHMREVIGITNRVSGTEREIDEIMAQGETVFNEFYGKSLLLMDDIVHSVAEETNYKINDVIEGNILVKKRFMKEKNK